MALINYIPLIIPLGILHGMEIIYALICLKNNLAHLLKIFGISRAIIKISSSNVALDG